MKQLLITLGCMAALAASSASSAFALNGYTPVKANFNALSTNMALESSVGKIACKTAVLSGTTLTTVSVGPVTVTPGLNNCKRETEPVSITTTGTWQIKETGLGSTEFTLGGGTISLPLGCTITIPKQTVVMTWENGSSELNPSTFGIVKQHLTTGGTCGNTEGSLNGNFATLDITHPTEPIKQT
jgi:hypothetical protein